jgi:hypothetical protein
MGGSAGHVEGSLPFTNLSDQVGQARATFSNDDWLVTVDYEKGHLPIGVVSVSNLVNADPSKTISAMVSGVAREPGLYDLEELSSVKVIDAHDFVESTGAATFSEVAHQLVRAATQQGLNAIFLSGVPAGWPRRLPPPPPPPPPNTPTGFPRRIPPPPPPPPPSPPPSRDFGPREGL